MYRTTKQIMFGALLAAVAASPILPVQTEGLVKYVPIRELVKNSANYNKQEICVDGFIHCGFEDTALYPSDTEPFPTGAIWITSPKNLRKELSKSVLCNAPLASNPAGKSRSAGHLTHQFVMVSGVFHSDAHGHKGGFIGEISVLKMPIPAVAPSSGS